MENRDNYKDILFGLAVGDALGVPVEFIERDELRKDPVTSMKSFGSHNQPIGTWSDDSALAFCLADTLANGFNLQALANSFVAWLYKNHWTPRGKVFDVGMATRRAIERLAKGKQPDLAGGFEISDNGNGSLMRILPLVFYLKHKTKAERFILTKQVSSLTHGHIRSVIACSYLLEFALSLMEGKNKWAAFEHVTNFIPNFLNDLQINPEEVKYFNRLFDINFAKLHEEDIYSSGYVVHTLEASIWCLLTTESYVEAVLKAVNLGEDTDTTGAVTGGLAGLLYGYEKIPESWRFQLARYNDIDDLSNRLFIKFTE